MTVVQNELAQLRILQRQYLQLVDLSRLRWPDAQVLKRAEVQSWIFLHMFNASTVRSPPPGRYQLRVLKLLISMLERSIVDPEEDVRFPVSSISFSIFSRPTSLCPVFSHICSATVFQINANARICPTNADRLALTHAGDFR